MKARINEWFRTALIMLGESIKLREMLNLPFGRLKNWRIGHFGC